MLEKAPAFSAVVLAAGKGTRMRSPLPKVLHKAAGLSLISHVLAAVRAVGGLKAAYVVVGHGREEVQAELGRLGGGVREVFQAEQNGTGHALQVASKDFQKDDSLILILNGDGPLVRPETLRSLIAAHTAAKADLTLGVTELAEPFGYGRVVLGAKNSIKKIVEEKEASGKEKKIRLINGGLYVVSRKFLDEFLPKLKPSAKSGELYLTDILALGAAKRKRLFAHKVPQEDLLGVNDQKQLAEVERVLRERTALRFQEAGVKVMDPSSLYADVTAAVEAGAVLHPNVFLYGDTRVGEGAVVEPGAVLINAKLGKNAVVKAYSHLEEASVADEASVGPFARLRPGADVGKHAKIGNFVELKKASIGEGSKISHLSYVGDAKVGRDVNIGCGFITCNYDGFQKHVTTIEDEAFVGSDVQAVAPLKVGARSYVASGTTLTQDVPADSLAVARTKQENKEGYAPRLRSRMKAAAEKSRK